MPKTLIDLYNDDFPEFLNLKRDIVVQSPLLHQQVRVIQRLHFDFDNRATFLSFYIPLSGLTNVSLLIDLLSRSDQVTSELSSTVQTAQGGTDGNLIYSNELVYSRKIYLYCEQYIGETDHAKLQDIADNQNIHAVLRGNDYTVRRNNLDKVIEEFLDQYKTDQKVYEDCVALLKEEITQRLKEASIPALVTARIKNIDSLKTKILKRALPLENGKSYTSTYDIYNDIVDLGGIRIALYFPGQRTDAKKIIEACFGESDERIYTGGKTLPNYDRRFSGYWATHYRATLDPNHQFIQNRLTHDVRIEIQVASIVMHAWAEVAHDLEYKKLQGQLWKEEEKLLDQLNGLVLTGEMILESLQESGNRRRARLKELIEHAQKTSQSGRNRTPIDI